MFSVFIEIPRQFLLQQFCHIIAEVPYLVLLMGVAPDGILSGAEQELVAVRFFPELAQYTIPLSMDGQIKHPGKGKNHASGYIDACGQQEKLPHLGREREVQHAFLIPDLFLRGGRLDFIRGVQHLCQCLAKLGVLTK